MTPQEFVSRIRSEVLEQNLAIYCQNLEDPRSTTIGRGAHWPRMAELYQSLTEDQRRLFVEGVRQVMVDTLSNVLGILDGSTLLGQHRDCFHLTYGGDHEVINGELLDLFLSHET